MPSNWRANAWASLLAMALLLLSAGLAGCARPLVATGEQLARFNAAGPTVPAISPGELPEAKPLASPYRVVAGDVLEFRLKITQDAPESAAQPPPRQESDAGRNDSQAAARRPDLYRVCPGDVLDLAMPSVLRGIGEAGDRAASYACRVSQEGSIWLPVVGEMPVAGKTLLEIETAVTAAYFPKYVKNRPAVIARVSERGTSVLSVVSTAAGPAAARDPFADSILCRVTDEGMVRLPLAGSVPVAGKSVAEIEAAVAAAYYPKHLSSPPSVLARVADYRVATVYAIGAIGSPGRYELRSNELELAVLLAKAGGIGVGRTASGVGAGGAKVIRIRHAGQPREAKPLEVPVRDRNIPIANVALQDGDTVEVEHFDDPLFTVTGLVMSPGVHPYPPGAKYTLQQVLAMSGGIDTQAGPRYATIYRQDGNGKTIAAEFRIGGRTMVDASEVIVKPGDVICLEHSFRTRWNKFWATVLHFGAGAYATVPITTTSSR
ncbi:MAG TPA: polysaccharide biosynthesis/export family protein [Planctomycetota bacterium]|nr:polysaccharide biosynthesis/export family protein [Planctomycetota bacterium]HRR78700.1 polysaccharide biosynthesis/export family protein [Planctomycetota bacterium]HRT96174.1 polysaccharide biosynthesis/export family protein [Planctomycetota bacterium]